MTLAAAVADATADKADPDTLPIDHVILTPDSQWAYDVAPSYAAASLTLGRLLQKDERRFRQATIVPLDTYVDARERKYLDDPIVEIEAASFDQALNCLPPLDWRREAGVERFCLSEFTDGRITRQYARLGDRYFSRSVRFRDPSTYLTAESINAAIAAGAVQQAEPQ